MKTGLNFESFSREIIRQNASKRDYVIDTNLLHMDAAEGVHVLDVRKPDGYLVGTMPISDIAHRQIGTYLNIPAKYYDKMKSEYPELLAANVNGWFGKNVNKRMVRTLDGRARAFLSNRYHPIDNYEVATAVLPIIGGLKDAVVESMEITDQRMYIKVVNPRLQAEVVPGDIVQSGVIITNSEVGASSVSVQPLVFRLVCKNGMVVNDAATRKYHVGRQGESDENFNLYRDETMIADDKAFLMKLQDTVRSVAEETQFGRVVDMMRSAKGVKLPTSNLPTFIEVTAKEFDLSKAEGDGILEHLIMGGDLSLYGLANAVTRHSQDIKSYDRATELESIGFDIMTMDKQTFNSITSLVV